MEMKDRSEELNGLYGWSLDILRHACLGARNEVIQGILRNKAIGRNGVLSYSNLHNASLSPGGVLPKSGTWLYFGPRQSSYADFLGRPSLLAYGVMSKQNVECGNHVRRVVVSWGIMSNQDNSIQLPVIISEAG